LLLGYNNQPELDREKILVKDGIRGWRSGDLGRHLPSGQFEIFGRMDSMCKVKGGFRVELTEIRTQIRSYPEVKDCVVSLVDGPNLAGGIGERHIVAHVAFKCRLQRAEIAEQVGSLNCAFVILAV
jgi:acyl-coenzyme A synthetase/AMP-(fatty) acid ligase